MSNLFEAIPFTNDKKIQMRALKALLEYIKLMTEESAYVPSPITKAYGQLFQCMSEGRNPGQTEAKNILLGLTHAGQIPKGPIDHFQLLGLLGELTGYPKSIAEIFDNYCEENPLGPMTELFRRLHNNLEQIKTE